MHDGAYYEGLFSCFPTGGMKNEGIRKIENQKSCAAMARLLLQADTLRRVASMRCAALFWPSSLSFVVVVVRLFNLFTNMKRACFFISLRVCALLLCTLLCLLASQRPFKFESAL
jgi:hypothetical protein